MDTEQLLRPAQAARILGVCTYTLTNWHRKGLLSPVVLPSGQRRFKMSEIVKLKNGK